MDECWQRTLYWGERRWTLRWRDLGVAMPSLLLREVQEVLQTVLQRQKAEGGKRPGCERGSDERYGADAAGETCPQAYDEKREPRRRRQVGARRGGQVVAFFCTLGEVGRQGVIG